MTVKDKVLDLFKKHLNYLNISDETAESTAKDSTLISIENEYKSLREQLFNLRACKVIEDFAVYNHRLNELIEQEEDLKQEINKL